MKQHARKMTATGTSLGIIACRADAGIIIMKMIVYQMTATGVQTRAGVRKSNAGII